MIKNKAMSAFVIGACLIMTTATSVYADTNDIQTKPAITSQIVDPNPLTQKQQEIDQYVFEEHKAELDKLGINVVSTSVVGEYVEVAIEPFNAESADYLYKQFGNEIVQVVAGEQAVPLDLVTITADVSAQSGMVQDQEVKSAVQEATGITAFFNHIIEWFKSIF